MRISSERAQVTEMISIDCFWWRKKKDSQVFKFVENSLRVSESVGCQRLLFFFANGPILWPFILLFSNGHISISDVPGKCLGLILLSPYECVEFYGHPSLIFRHTSHELLKIEFFFSKTSNLKLVILLTK